MARLRRVYERGGMKRRSMQTVVMWVQWSRLILFWDFQCTENHILSLGWKYTWKRQNESPSTRLITELIYRVRCARISSWKRFFELNREDSNARAFVYHDSRALLLEQNHHLLGRPFNRNWAILDLKTLPTMVVCDTFHEAAQMKGLLNVEKEREYVMTKAAVWQMPAQLRDIFLSIFVYKSVANPVALWTTFK